MDRYTRKDAEAAFDNLCAATGHRKATSYNDVGAWELDAVPQYGGYVINQISNLASGVTCPLGDTRHGARDFCRMVYFAIRVLEVSKADA